MTVLGNNVEVSLDNILFATDFSPASERAGPFASAVARHYASKVQLVHVVDISAAFQIPDAGGCIESFRQEGASSLKDAQEKFTSGGVEAESILREGIDPAKEVLQIAGDRLADLIVIGTRGQSRLARLAFGSVAEQLIHHAQCPVLTVGPDVKPPGSPDNTFHRIVYATDFSKEATKAAVFAMSFARESRAHVYLCHVLPVADRNHHADSTELTEKFTAELKQMVPDIAQQWCEPECIVEHGYAADGILLLAYRLKADLIVLGTRRFSHWFDRLQSGIAYDVIRAAACPVLTVCG